MKLILMTALLLQYGNQIFLIASIAFAIFACYMCKRSWSKAKPTKQVDDSGISARADYQDKLYLAGDPAGVYGRFDAYTMPMTRPMRGKL